MLFETELGSGSKIAQKRFVVLRVSCLEFRNHAELVDSLAQHGLDGVWDDARLNRSFKVDAYNVTNTVCEY